MHGYGAMCRKMRFFLKNAKNALDLEQALDAQCDLPGSLLRLLTLCTRSTSAGNSCSHGSCYRGALQDLAGAPFSLGSSSARQGETSHALEADEMGCAAR